MQSSLPNPLAEQQVVARPVVNSSSSSSSSSSESENMGESVEQRNISARIAELNSGRDLKDLMEK